MTVEQLQRFLAVADCLNFTTAAERLYVGQSTISRQIAALEQEFGVVLLIRGPRSVELTEAGRLLQSEGQKILVYLDQLKRRIAEVGSGAAGKLRFTTVRGYFPALNDLWSYTNETYPDLDLDLSYSRHVNVCNDLDVGIADFGVFYSFLDPKDDAYETISLAEETFVVLCSRNHWVASHPEGVYLDDLRNEDIKFGRSSIQMLHSGSRYHGDPVVEHPATSTMEGDMMRLQVNDGIMILPSSAAIAAVNDLVRIPLLDEDLRHSVLLVYRKDAVTSSMQCFLNVVQSYLNGELTETLPEE